jgi:hypothetical protein
MAYNEFGIYEPRDPDLDQMRLALTKRPDLASQIPGSNVQAPKPDRPLDRAELNFKNVATSLNPLMAMKTMQDAVKTAVINPLLMPASIAVEAAQGVPARQITGNRFYQAPVTPVGQVFERDLGKVMEAAKVPHMMPVTPRPAGMRPALTPNDVRVMGAEATRVARGVRDIPSDFANAQSGFTRIDPVTNQPTYGATLQGVAEGIGDLAQSRRDAGLSLIPGVPDVVTPETSLYAVRPKGSRLVTPTRTSPNPNFTYQRDTAGDILKNEFANPYATEITPIELEGIAESTQAKMPNARAVDQAFSAFANQRVDAMFPDAPDGFQAQEAFKAKYSTPESRAQANLQLLDDFITQTPEGQASGLVRPAELEQRHLAAMKWLTGPFSNYIERNLGTEGDPLVKLASQGFTMRPPEELRAEQVSRIGVAMESREKGGYPQEGSFETLIKAKESELDAARTELRDLETRRTELATAARAQGLEDPARLPAYAELTNPLRTKAAARDKLQKELDNLYTGAAYEDISDAAVRVRSAKLSQQNLDYPQKQFYPTLMQTPADALTYGASSGSVSDTGIPIIATEFYNDVMSGKIPLDKIEKTTVENFVRRKSEERVKSEAEKKAREAQYLATAEDNLKAVLQYDVPNDMTFGNAGVILLDQNTPESIAVARVSEDTAVLDHCVGEGGSASSSAINPFTGKQKRYEPIIDLVTGQKNPNASKSGTAYTRGLSNGSQLASIRSLENGRPVATLQFEPSHVGAFGQQMYRIGYASGYANGKIDPAYSTAIKDYLNSRADNIGGAGDNLADNADVYDTKSSDDLRKLARKTGLITADINDAADTLPRFVLPEDMTKAVSELATSASSARTAPVQGMRENDLLNNTTRDAIVGAFSTVANALDDAAARMFNGLYGDIRDLYLTGNATIGDLRMVRTRLENAEAYYANRGTPEGDAIAESISEILVPEIDNILEQRTQPNADFNFANLFEADLMHGANLPAPAPARAQGLGINFAGMRDRVVNDLARNEGADIAEGVLQAANATLDAIDPQQEPLRFATALRDAADAQLSERVELALYDLADQIDTAQARQVAGELLEMGRNADGTLDRPDLMNTITVLEMGQLDHPAYRDIPAGPVRAEAMRVVLDNLNRMIEDERIQNLFAPVNDIQQMTRQELVQRIDPDRWPIINARSDLAIIAARQDPDPTGFVDALRRGQLTDFTNGMNVYERESIAQDVRDSLFMQGAMQELREQPPAQPANLARRDPINRNIRTATTDALTNNLAPEDMADVTRLANLLTDVNDREDLPRIVDLVRNNLMGEWEEFDMTQREVLARRIDEHYENAPPTPVAMPAPNSPEAISLREDAESIANTLDEAYFADLEEGEDAVPLIRNYMRNLNVNMLEDLLGMAGDDYNITPQLVEAVRQKLEQYLEMYGGGAPDGYQAGGSVKKKDVPEVKTPWLFSVPTYSETVAYEMYPGQRGQDDQRDAARHMLAAGTLTRKYGPGTAEFLGKAHEFATSPIQAAKTLFGGKMPRDYDMDTHNNTIGMQLGQRAKTQAELEALVQLEAERASRTQIPGRAFINKADGGIVKQNPSVEQMRFEIMMRGK